MRKRSVCVVVCVIMIIFQVVPVLCYGARDGVVADERVVIIIDAGHGGLDGGAANAPKTEKEYNLLIAGYLRDELIADGRFEVHMTREGDTYLNKLSRALNILTYNADLMLSLHCNSNDSTSVDGSEAYVSVIDRYNASDLAVMILDNISESVPIRRGKVKTREDTGDSLGIYYWSDEMQWDMPGESSLGVKSDYYSMNTWSSKFGTPSIIIEHAYVSNKNDAEILESDENLKKIAAAEAKALCDYYFGHEHVFGTEKTVDFPSNCTLNGTKSYRCEICGVKRDTEQLPPTPDRHFMRAESSYAATCTEDGGITYVCQISYNLNDRGYDCEVHRTTEIIPKKGHNYEITEDIKPTGNIEGHRTEKCVNCGDEITEIYPACEHEFREETTNPTCTESGKIEKVCLKCGYMTSEDLPMLGHDYEVTEDVKATCTEEGKRTEVCSVCGEVRTKTTPATGHEFPEIGKRLCVYCGFEEKSAASDNSDDGRRSILELFNKPIVMVILCIIVVQLIALAIVIPYNRRRLKKLRNRARDFSAYESNEYTGYGSVYGTEYPPKSEYPQNNENPAPSGANRGYTENK